jgi:hypothetical protein
MTFVVNLGDRIRGEASSTTSIATQVNAAGLRPALSNRLSCTWNA